MKKAFRVLALSLVLITLVAALASCGGPAADPDDALAALKKNDFKAGEDKIVIPLALKALGVDGIDSVVSGTRIKDDKGDHVTIIYFEDKDSANDAWEKVKKYAEDNKEDDSDWTIKKSGAMIYWGTSAGIKAAK